ncbi:MAG: class I SAM-dependent methyltransferase [Peptoanaerobacter stomatis]
MNCESCGSKNIIKKNYKLINDVYFCNDCGLYFVPNLSFDNDSINNNINVEERIKGLYSVRMENFKKICSYVSKYFETGEVKGLEVGSSYGWFLDEVNKLNNVTCDGIEPEIIENNENRKYKVINGFFPQDLYNNGEEKINYDFIIFNDVFEHIPNCNSTIKECFNHLNEKGLLIINIPVSSGIIFNISRLLNFLGNSSFFNRMWQFNFHSPHIYYFNEKNLCELAKNNGFEIKDILPMKTLSKDGIKERILSDKKIKSAKFTSIVSKISIPIVNNFFQDTKVFFFKKI